MRNSHEHNFDILILGGGPAGIAAACAASGHGNIAIVDENPTPGGQIWRNGFPGKQASASAQWHQRLTQAQVAGLHGLRVFHAPASGVLHAEGPDGLHILRYKKLILATGARELFLPFPGWTLRNIMGVGGLQAMVKSGLPISGKRIVIAGSGPLLLAVAAYLKSHRAHVVSICEQATLSQLVKFTTALATQPSKVAQALRYRMQLAGVPYRTGWWPTEARGESQLESVTITDGARSQTLDCDYLACGFHLVPNTELPSLLGCALQHGFVAVDSMQQTSVAGVYCAGEITGIGGLKKSLIEGEIAAHAATGQLAYAQKLFGKHSKAMRFAAAMHQAFALREELRRLPTPDTLICRCEDVSCRDVQQHNSWRSARLHTRCGMGPCQGRVCGTAAAFLFRWPVESVRPPVLPVRFDTLAGAENAAAHQEILL